MLKQIRTAIELCGEIDDDGGYYDEDDRGENGEGEDYGSENGEGEDYGGESGEEDSGELGSYDSSNSISDSDSSENSAYGE